LIILILVLIPEYQYFQNRPQVDRSKDYYARDYGTMMLSACPANAILLVNWDDLFILWYLQKVENIRPDIVPVLADFPLNGQGGFWGKWIFDDLMVKYPDMFEGTGIGSTPFQTKEAAINDFVNANITRKRPVYFSFYGLNYDFKLLDAKVFPVGPVYKAGIEPYTQLDVLVAKENWQKAIDKFRNMYTYDKHRVDEEDFLIARISTNLGNTGTVVSNIDANQAIWFFEKAVSINPGNLPALESLAGIYLQQKRYDELKDLLLKAQKVDPYDSDVYWFLSLVYNRLGDKVSELDMLQKVLEIDPNHPEARTQLERLRGTTK
jgi:tetratricopeptide (TPR) repeat protein